MKGLEGDETRSPIEPQDWSESSKKAEQTNQPESYPSGNTISWIFELKVLRPSNQVLLWVLQVHLQEAQSYLPRPLA